MRDFRFGVGLRAVEGRDEWIALCRRVEELGYDTISVPDHLGAPSPFPALAVAAAVTERVRVGPLVLNVPFHNPALLARDVATVDRLSGGRLELGLGAGHMRAEFEDAGIPWPPGAERTERLRHTVAELDRRFGTDQPAPQQQPGPPLLIAGNSDGVLELAARRGDIVGFAGLRQLPGAAPGTFTLDGPQGLDERVEFVRTRLAGRDPEFNLLIQHVAVTTDPTAEIDDWLGALPHRSRLPEAAELRDYPQLLVGTTEEIVARLRERRERFGFSYVTVLQPALETFAPVIAALRAS